MAGRFGRYRLEELLGRGGMGEVHRATDLVKNREVALKTILPHLASDPRARTRFEREASLVARLHDPHVVPIHDYGEVDGQLYLDMRLVRGTDLPTILRRDGPSPAWWAVTVPTQAADALDAAHTAGLVHRDVKPSNMLIGGRPGRPFVHLLDFGIAHALQGVGSTRITGTGQAVGTPAYMAPERFTDDLGDHRVDVYALGCVLVEMLTGAADRTTSPASSPTSSTGRPARRARLATKPRPRPTHHKCRRDAKRCDARTTRGDAASRSRARHAHLRGGGAR